MFFSKKLTLNSDDTVVNRARLETLTQKAAILDQLIENSTLQKAQRITENALAVNQASSQRLEKVEHNFQLVEKLTSQSEAVAECSRQSSTSAQQTNQNSAQCIEQLSMLQQKISTAEQKSLA